MVAAGYCGQCDPVYVDQQIRGETPPLDLVQSVIFGGGGLAVVCAELGSGMDGIPYPHQSGNCLYYRSTWIAGTGMFGAGETVFVGGINKSKKGLTNEEDHVKLIFVAARSARPSRSEADERKRKKLLTRTTEHDKIDLVAAKEASASETAINSEIERSLKTEERMNDPVIS